MKRNSEPSLDEIDIISSLANASSNNMSDLEKLTHLMQRLLASVQQNRDTRVAIEERATQILEAERQKVGMLAKCTNENVEEVFRDIQKQDDAQKAAAASHQSSKVSEDSDNATVNVRQIDELTREKLALQIELQSLEEVGEKYEQIIERYKTALSYVQVLVESHSTSYAPALHRLEQSLQIRVEQEENACIEVLFANKDMLETLHNLKRGLTVAHSRLQGATEELQPQMDKN